VFVQHYVIAVTFFDWTKSSLSTPLKENVLTMRN